MDPIRHNVLFERFLNPGRHDPPDIDVDVPWDERPALLGWVFKHYGHQQVAMVANQNTHNGPFSLTSCQMVALVLPHRSVVAGRFDEVLVAMVFPPGVTSK